MERETKWLYLIFKASSNLCSIWRNQALPSELEESIRIVSKAAYDHLVQGAKGGNVTEWAKREACWDEFKKLSIQKIPNLLMDTHFREVGTAGRDSKSALPPSCRNCWNQTRILA